MNIINVCESGCSNILLWAIANGANVHEDIPLQSIVNDELFYHVTLNDVNFFELFRLTQMYREKVRIISEEKAEIPPRSELVKLFDGTYIPDESNPENKAHLSECVEHVTQNFINIALQMSGDDDIIKPSAVRLFLPMISRKFTVVIPVAFSDLVNSISEDEAGKIFNKDYPKTLDEIANDVNHGFNVKFKLAFIQATWINKYNKRYDQYLKITKYSPLKNAESANKLYKFGLLGMYKYNNITRGQIKCNLFNADKSAVPVDQVLKQIGSIKTPLQVEFAVQLPIQYMQILENSLSREVLDIKYESSMSNIIDGGLIYEDFITPILDENEQSEELKSAYTEVMNNIEAYRMRITEANQLLLNTITMLLNNEGDIDTSSVFAMLPSIYTTKAIITINMEHENEYTSVSDPVVSEMFKEMISVVNSMLNDLKK